ncbi:hypothetical protein LTR97_010802 [Elasticomyces elasticus]|uniref:BTB domain-containing protein n=1 Tax=Elasticomyces elasticus TaxID=574655 RepID=A0AAN7ZLC3_9PEZI|nr:hypothetical protein LTR97_010802 [Elasticomyces elasticus]KAK5718629.1 hypothetical protein LTR15_008362 [Elasticomyces elasticus]
MAGTLEGELIAIVADGDVLFNVGTATAARLRVSSDTLIRASKVFASLLGPCFHEGSLDRSSHSPADIALPDDDAIAMEDMCRFLHGESVPQLVEDLNSARIYKLAIAIDKYDCTERLRFHSQALLLGFWDAYDGNDPNPCLVQMAAAAYLLNHARTFSVATRHIIMDTNEDYSELFETDIAHVFPLAAILALGEKRTAAHANVSFYMPRLGMPVCGSDCDNWESLYSEALCRMLETDYWPPSFQHDPVDVYGAQVLRELVDCLKTKKSYARETPSCRHTGSVEEVTESMFRDFAKKLEDSCRGLCLICVRGGERAAVLRMDCMDHSQYW